MLPFFFSKLKVKQVYCFLPHYENKINDLGITSLCSECYINIPSYLVEKKKKRIVYDLVDRICTPKYDGNRFVGLHDNDKFPSSKADKAYQNLKNLEDPNIMVLTNDEYATGIARHFLNILNKNTDGNKYENRIAQVLISQYLSPYSLALDERINLISNFNGTDFVNEEWAPSLFPTEEDENLTYYLNVLLVKEQNREQNTNFKNLSDFLLSDHGKERLEEEEEIIRSSIEDYFCDDSVTREEAQEELREIVEGFWSEVGESFSNID